MPTSKIELVVFDLYDTLVSYHRKGPHSYSWLLMDLGLAPEEAKEAYRVGITENFPDLASFIAKIKPNVRPRLPLSAYEEDIAREIASTRPYPETIPVLEELRKRGLSLALLSNAGTPYKEPFFTLGLEKYFTQVVFSCDVGMRKPEEGIYRRLLRDIWVAPQNALMIGDKLDRDVLGPQSVGMRAVLLDRDGQSNYSPKIETLQGVFDYI